MKFISLLLGAVAAQTIYFIRHGEQDANSGEDLSAQVFAGKKQKYPSPDTLIAQNPADHSHRAVETITPLSHVLNIPIQDQCDRDDITCATNLINSNIQKGSKIVLVAWEHGQLGSIAANFVSGPAPVYPGSHYDLIWEVDYKSQSYQIKREVCKFQ
ncbi:hypothetical protein HK103_000571 [Boothiomyces macroporosus]|uniref:Phosphoglycerate mutase family protein n=1 Tax=Boothiomyces macroporosus TaxID=261099 RepID=A0AAD5YA63_9FUNG|nr:hypothetical protein HK103_000571 [Boothiomyces macroporosus]